MGNNIDTISNPNALSSLFDDSSKKEFDDPPKKEFDDFSEMESDEIGKTNIQYPLVNIGGTNIDIVRNKYIWRKLDVIPVTPNHRNVPSIVDNEMIMYGSIERVSYPINGLEEHIPTGFIHSMSAFVLLSGQYVLELEKGVRNADHTKDSSNVCEYYYLDTNGNQHLVSTDVNFPNLVNDQIINIGIDYFESSHNDDTITLQNGTCVCLFGDLVISTMIPFIPKKISSSLSLGHLTEEYKYPHALVLHEGRVYTWGHGNMGQLGVGELIQECGTLMEVKYLNDVIDIMAAPGVSYALRPDGLYRWGQGTLLPEKIQDGEFSPNALIYFTGKEFIVVDYNKLR